jgi:hypothetical protein
MCLLCNGTHTDGHGSYQSITFCDLEAAAHAAGVSVTDGARNLAKAVAARERREQVLVAKQAGTAEYAACRVVKTAAEQRYTLGLAYPAMRLDAGVAADGHIDFVSPEALEQTAWNWMSKQRTISLFHTQGSSTDGHATAVESYIYRGPDWQVGETVVKAGDWLLGTVWDEHGWQLVKAGLVNGWSPEGGARRSRPSPERLALLR